MSIRNLKDGSNKPWLFECYPDGRGRRRVRKRFATKGEASAYEKFIIREMEDKPWLGDKPDNRRLSNLIDIWFAHYGKTLVNGSAIYAKFQLMVEAMGNPIASQFNVKMYSEFRSLRMAAKFCLSMRTDGKEASQVYPRSTPSWPDSKRYSTNSKRLASGRFQTHSKR